ncbi:MAG: PIG-L family deacetylase [Arachnia sp.]
MSAPAPTFTHGDAGTPESVWWSSPHWDQVPLLDLSAVAKKFSRVVIVSAHPDDETLGAGGLLADLSEIGVPLTVVVATAGEKSQPNATKESQALMALQRRREVEQAVGCLAPAAHLLHLGLPDGDLVSHETQLGDEITRLSDINTLILAPWIADGHPDHDASGRAAIAASSASGAAIAHFPIWLWHWDAPEHLPWEHLVIAETSLAGCWRRRDAVACFTSQLHPAHAGSDALDGAPILGASMKARSRRLVDVLIDENHALPMLTSRDRVHHTESRSARLDTMYDGGSDPWNNCGSFYEERRRALVLAMLGAARYNRVLELGCADGFLTAALVDRANEVLAFDTSPRAVAAARINAPSAAVHQGDLPGVIPGGAERFDLIVLSEVGYFLSATELLATLRRARAVLSPGAELLLCHWQHPTKKVPLDGELVHQQARDFMGAQPRASYRDPDLCIEIWGDAPSVAASEGRV